MRGRIRGLSTRGGGGLAADVVVTSRADGQGYAAALVFERDGVRSTRELVGEACDVLADAVAVVVAIEGDGAANVASDAAVPEPAEPASTVPAAPPDATAPTPAPGPASDGAPRGADRGESRRARPRVAVRAAGGVEGRGAPGLTGVLALGTGIRWSRWHLDLELAHAFARTRRLPAPSDDVGARVGLWSASLGGAFVPTRGRVGVPLSLRLELGDAVASGFGDASSRRAHALWLATRLGVGLRIDLGQRVTLGLDPSMAIAWVRPRFAARTPNGEQTVAQAAWIGWRVVAGVEVHFP